MNWAEFVAQNSNRPLPHSWPKASRYYRRAKPNSLVRLTNYNDCEVLKNEK